MRKHFKLLAFATALLTLAACADEDVMTPQQARDNSPESNAITFGAYSGKSRTTRAGATSGSNYMNTAKLKTQGFGVIAYYTAKDTYGQYRKASQTPTDIYKDEAARETGSSTNSTANDYFPNFMYNQKVIFSEVGKEVDGTTANNYDGNITGWAYTPIKYWPNENNNSDGQVDDLGDGGLTDGKATEGNNAGRVSFFAYAPWVELSETALTGRGITYINGSNKLTENDKGNLYKGDPYVTYEIPQNNEGFVDLLWGTQMKGTASENVVEDPTPGVKSEAENLVPWPENATLYKKEILKNYTMNADLTKQKTSGSVGFLFKHALGILGGSSETTTNEPKDKDYQWGFRVVLDNDKDGAIQGGLKGKETVVLIEYVKVDAISYADVDHDGVLDEDEKTNVVTSHVADFNLATGKWDIQYYDASVSSSSRMTRAPQGSSSTAVHQYQYIVPKTSGVDPLGKTVDSWNSFPTNAFYLNTTLHEVKTAPTATNGIFHAATSEEDTDKAWIGHSSHNGVLNTTKNLYDESADYDPLVFFPGTFPELTITVKYVVRTKDTNLSKGYSEVVQEITKKLTFEEAIQLNKKYNLLMHLGLTSVKFTAQVDDWDDLNDGNRDDDGTGTGTSIRITDDVYAPQNVGGGSMNDGITENITLDYSVAATSVAVSGLVSGQTYTINKTGNNWPTSGTGGAQLDVTYATTKTQNNNSSSAATFTAAGSTEIIYITGMPQSTSNKTYSIKVTGPYKDSSNDTQQGGEKTFTITKEAAPLVLTAHEAIIPANGTTINIDATTPNGTKVKIANATDVTITPSGGTINVDTDGLITITGLSANTSDYNVIYEFTVKSGEQTETIKVAQAPAVEKMYTFTSYSSKDATSKLSEGRVRFKAAKTLTIAGVSTPCNEVKVLYNSVTEFIGNTYYVIATEPVNETTRTQLYTADGKATGMWVTITYLSDTYSFKAYSASSGGTEWSTGKVKLTGNHKINVQNNWCQEVEVTENSVDGWVGNKYYVVVSAVTGTSRYRLWEDTGGAQLTGTSPAIYVAISDVESE